MSKTIEEQLAEILEEYADKVGDIDEKENKKVSSQAAKELRTTSPKEDGSYAGKWTYKKIEGGFIVYNKEGWKTHLLEKGHVIKNKRGGPEYGRVNGRPHIKPVEEKYIKQLMEDLKKDIEK